MKRLLLFTTLLAIILVGCKKETSLNTTGVTKSYKQVVDETRYRPSYYNGYEILNLYYNDPWSFLGYKRDNEEDLYVVVHNIMKGAIRDWNIEYLSIGGPWPIVKFTSISDFLAVESAPRPDGSFNVVHKRTEEYYVADWKLIGVGNPLACLGESPSSFIGVIVNIKTGKMLEANKSKSGIIDVFVSKKWEGSELQKIFEQDGDWSELLASSSHLKKCLWKIDAYYRRKKDYWIR